MVFWKSKVPQIEDTLAALVERGKRTTNIGEKITIAFELIRELKTIPTSSLKEEVREKFVKLNEDMYSFLHSIKDYVADYESDYQILADFQKEWSPEECPKKTKEYLTEEIDGEPSLLSRIVASTKEFQKKLGDLLIDITKVKDLCDRYHISGKNWVLIGAGAFMVICGIAALIVPCSIPAGIAFILGGVFTASYGASELNGDFNKRRAIEEFQRELQDSVDFLQGTLHDLDPLISDHDNAVKNINGKVKRGKDFNLANAARMCETFSSLHAAFRTAVGAKVSIQAADPPIPLGYVLTGVAAVGLVTIAHNAYVPVAQQH